MTKSSKTPLSPMPPLEGPKFDTASDFEHQLEAATAHIPTTYDFESADFRQECESPNWIKKFEFKSTPFPLPTAYSFIDIGIAGPVTDELVKLEAEVGSLDF